MVIDKNKNIKFTIELDTQINHISAQHRIHHKANVVKIRINLHWPNILS